MARTASGESTRRPLGPTRRSRSSGRRSPDRRPSRTVRRGRRRRRMRVPAGRGRRRGASGRRGVSRSVGAIRSTGATALGRGRRAAGNGRRSSPARRRSAPWRTRRAAGRLAARPACPGSETHVGVAEPLAGTRHQLELGDPLPGGVGPVLVIRERIVGDEPRAMAEKLLDRDARFAVVVEFGQSAGRAGRTAAACPPRSGS